MLYYIVSMSCLTIRLFPLPLHVPPPPAATPPSPAIGPDEPLLPGAKTATKPHLAVVLHMASCSERVAGPSRIISACKSKRAKSAGYSCRVVEGGDAPPPPTFERSARLIDLLKASPLHLTYMLPYVSTRCTNKCVYHTYAVLPCHIPMNKNSDVRMQPPPQPNAMLLSCMPILKCQSPSNRFQPA
ncbi:hypothetical protein CH063_09183 [Colletotrichum higginsianum]|uniref:Uncharacterized protein n=1 Tax=Colletotrichum higginsianum (strain IMI 349063) TaxID=759273 RepID=H1VCL9_COLHI|nr:hypothetical protein CH063_09183 [Colletotrichum higginsianum]